MKLPFDKVSRRDVPESADERKAIVRDLIERARKFRKKFPPGFKFDRYEANERR